jgi:dipeptidyl aminopeptidase/acylaminoacyl peptidase
LTGHPKEKGTVVYFKSLKLYSLSFLLFSIWAQILSRDQKKSAVILLSPSQFHQTRPDTIEHIEVLWEETNEAWVNITDVYYFMKQSEDIKFIWSSESVNGYRHLFLIEKTKQHKQVTQLTSGDWCCIDRPLFVDESRSLVYFSAKMHTPLETHFYVLSYTNKGQPQLLTQLGFNHTVTMESPDYFVDCFSSLHDPQVIVVRKLNQHQQEALLMPVAINQEPYETPPSPPPSTNGLYSSKESFSLSKYRDSTEPNGEIFSFTTSDGANLYGCLYKPRHYEPGKSYPTLLHIYGGPKTQLIVNEFKFPRLIRYLMSVYFDFAVVIIDSRGSSDRGLQFESYVKHRLGTVELGDQLEGLQFLHDTKFAAIPSKSDGVCRPVIDMGRLAITGWSYGGYLSLMALAQYPDVFKMAIAGAPVTQWELYDAAYTERYMGLPSENEEAYRASNVLSYIDRFPNR